MTTISRTNFGLVVIEIRAAIEDSEVIIIDITEIIAIVLSTIHKNGPT
jgi:hypothetical protein